MHSNNKIPNYLHNLSENVDFHEWCEKIGNEYYIKSQNCIPINIEKYYKLRDIKEVEYSSKIASLARIISINSGFLIQLNSNKIKTPKQVNYYIAHEIAHTFFYEKHNNDFIHVKNIIPGSDELEYACDRIARCLILPQAPLVDELAKYPSVNDDAFSLKIINELSNYFGLTHTLFILRITHDLGLWKNFLLVRFMLFNKALKEWRITENYFDFTNIKEKKIFIPPPDKFKKWMDPKKYPSAKDNLLNFVEKCFKEMQYGQEDKVTIKSDDITGKPLGSFFKYFNGRTFNNCIVSKSKFKNNEYLNFLIRLDEKFIH